MDNNFGHDTFVVVDGRIGTPVNDPGLDEDWLVWLGGSEVVRASSVDAWFGEYGAERNLSNAIEFVRAQSEVAALASDLTNTVKRLEKARVP